MSESSSENPVRARTRLGRALVWVDENIEYWLNFVFYTFLTWIIVIEVFRRYVFDSATTYGEETARYAFIWLAYVAAARGVKNRTHLAIDILPQSVGRTFRFWLFMLNDLCFFTLAVIIVWTSTRFVSTTIEYGQNFQGIDLPLWIAVSAIPVGWGLIMIRVIQRNINTINDFRAGRPITAGFLGST
jgi:TRAP-type C4-dicarboxylate transport system permease small subunit